MGDGVKSEHYKLLIVSGDGFKRLREELVKYEWSEELGYGFKITENDTNRVRGTCVYRAPKKLKDFDPEKGWEERYITVRSTFAFELNQTKGLVMVQGRRGDLGVLFGLLDAIPLLHIVFDELRLNLHDLMYEVQRAYKRNKVYAFKIADYLARENMLASASFKVLDEHDGEKIADKFSDQLDAFVLKLKLPDGPVSLRVSRKGSVSASDDTPDELMLFVRELIPRFHEAEVETVVAVKPRESAA